MQLLERIISVYAPLTCLGCGFEGAIICEACLAGLPPALSQCGHCNDATRLGRTCSKCRLQSHLVSVNAATPYEGLAKDLVWRLKFARAQAAADAMAAIMVSRYGSMVAPDVLIVPVPTATKRVRGRGYDQAVLIAKAFARRSGRRYTSLLIRRGTQEQIGASKTQRRAQLHGVFRVKDVNVVRGSRILLIDDVVTTGSTLETAAEILATAGARSVGALVFAQAQKQTLPQHN